MHSDEVVRAKRDGRGAPNAQELGWLDTRLYAKFSERDARHVENTRTRADGKITRTLGDRIARWFFVAMFLAFLALVITGGPMELEPVYRK